MSEASDSLNKFRRRVRCLRIDEGWWQFRNEFDWVERAIFDGDLLALRQVIDDCLLRSDVDACVRNRLNDWRREITDVLQLAY